MMPVATSILCVINWCDAANSEAQWRAATASAMLFTVRAPRILKKDNNTSVTVIPLPRSLRRHQEFDREFDKDNTSHSPPAHWPQAANSNLQRIVDKKNETPSVRITVRRKRKSLATSFVDMWPQALWTCLCRRTRKSLV